MLKSDYICYYSLFHDVDKHDVLQHIDKVLEAGNPIKLINIHFICIRKYT